VFLLFNRAAKLEQLFRNRLTGLSHDLLQLTSPRLVGWLKKRVANAGIAGTTGTTNLYCLFVCLRDDVV
jgi:hypothetical protein